MGIRNICVVGGGHMDRQIALNAAIYGYGASAYDLASAVCGDVVKWADEYLSGRVAKGRLTGEQVAGVKSLFRGETDLAKAFGHPNGASGARICLFAMKELERRGGRYGLFSSRRGGGHGVTTLIENLRR